MTDLKHEKADLSANLKEVRDKICSQWTQKEQLGDIHGRFKEHEAALNNMLEKAKEIFSLISDTENKTADNQSALKYCSDKHNSVKESEVAVQLQNDRLLQEKEVLTSDIESLKQDIEKLQHDFGQQKEQIETKRAALEKSVKLFQDCFGLQFKKVSGNRLQVIFTCLDARRINVNANFCVKITGEKRAYTVTSCDPPVPDLDTLVDRLNTTNDFRSFCMVMRKRFKEIV